MGEAGRGTETFSIPFRLSWFLFPIFRPVVKLTDRFLDKNNVPVHHPSSTAGRSCTCSTLMMLSLSMCLGACSPRVPEILPPSSAVTLREALETSRAYTTIAWKGSAGNVRHGEDEDGIRIDTPDADAPVSFRHPP